MTDELDKRVNTEVRTRLRAAVDAICALRDYCKPDDGFAAQFKSCGEVLAELEDGFPEDVRGQCEGCLTLILIGEQGHQCLEGELLCKACAPSWGDVKEQWEDGTLQGDAGAEDSDLASFMRRYQKHIADGGKPDDLMLYTL